MKDFNILPPELVAALSSMGITEPTPVQAQCIEPGLLGKDVTATAQTGTGKTMGFLLPLLVNLEKNPKASALILSPTRELAQQTQQALAKISNIKSALVIGGDSIQKQFAELRKKPRVIVATPGRVIDHMERKSITLSNVAFLVLDETDRMLDMGFIAPLRKIVAVIPTDRQTFMFSATMPKEIVALANQFLKNPVTIKIGSVTRPVDLVLQESVSVTTREKLNQLLLELETRQGSVLIFVKTKHGADRLATQLKQYGHKVSALHGDLRQNRRRQVLEQFRDETTRILVATDVAARGIDVPHIGHVVNYDLPMCPEDYIHRIGRTGRAGAVGSAISFICEDGGKWKDICKVIGKETKVVSKTRTSRELPAPKFKAEDLRQVENERYRRPSEGRGQRGERGDRGGRSSAPRRGDRPQRSARPAYRSDAVERVPEAAPAREERPEFHSDKPSRPINTSRKALRSSLEVNVTQRAEQEASAERAYADRPARRISSRSEGSRSEGRGNFERKPSTRSEGRSSSFGRKPAASRGERSERTSSAARGERSERTAYAPRTERTDRKPSFDRADRPARGEKKPSFGARSSYGKREDEGKKTSFGRKPSFGAKPGARSSYGKREDEGRKSAYAGRSAYGKREDDGKKSSYGRKSGASKDAKKSSGGRKTFAAAKASAKATVSGKKPSFFARFFKGKSR